MAATLTSLDAALKETWTSDRLEEQLYNENPFLDEIEKTTRYQVGAQAVTPLHVGRNGGYTALPAAGGTLNTAGEQQLAQAVWNYSHHHQQVKIQGSAIDGTLNNSVAVAQAIDVEITGALSDLRKQLTRQAFSNGDARIATCGTTSAAAVVVLESGFAGTGWNALQRGWLYPGLYVDIGTSANEVADIDGEAITAVSAVSATPTITVTSAITTNSSDFVSVKNARSGTTSYEMNGLKNIAGNATSTLGGVTVAAQPSWAPSVDSTTTSLSLDTLLAQQQATTMATGSAADYVLFSVAQQTNFYKLLQQQVRFAGEGGLGAGKVEGASWNGLKIQAHPDVPNGHVYLLNKKHLFIVSAGKPYWQNQVTGGKALDWVQGEDAYGGKLTYRINLATNKRNAHAAITGLTS